MSCVHLGDLRYCVDGREQLLCYSEICLTGVLARAGFAVVARLDAQELDEAFTGAIVLLPVAGLIDFARPEVRTIAER